MSLTPVLKLDTGRPEPLNWQKVTIKKSITFSESNMNVQQLTENSPANSNFIWIKTFQKLSEASPEVTVPAPELMCCHPQQWP